MNYIGIDISLTSTAVTVKNFKGYFFFSYFKGYEKPGKWTKLLEDFTKITGTFCRKSEDYSEQEIFKLEDYYIIVEMLRNDLLKCLEPGKTYVGIEGYSFSSSYGRIIDIVTMSTLIRQELFRLGFELHIFSPSTLKKETCGLVYGWKTNTKGKIIGTRNKIGIAGGSFKKPQMLEALTDSNIDSKLVKFTKDYKKEILDMKNIPHPLEDIIDSHWCLEILINKLKHFPKIIV